MAQHVIHHYWEKGKVVTAVCRLHRPDTGKASMVDDPKDVAEPIDLLITMPGAECAVKLDRATDEEWQRVLDANLLSVARAFRELLPKVRDGGNVVVVGSVMGRLGGHGCGPYAAAKAGLVGLVRAAANEHAKRRVCVNLLELGHVDCGMGARLPEKVKAAALAAIPLGRFAEPAEVVEAIAWLGRQRWMTGYVVPFAGGL